MKSTPFSGAELALLKTILSNAVEVFGVQTCNEIKLEDTADNRALAQAVIGEEYQLRYERGKLVLSAEEVASYFEKRAKRQLRADVADAAPAAAVGDTREQVRQVSRIKTQLQQQFEARQSGAIEAWAYVESTLDKVLVDMAVELLGEELGAAWRLHCPNVANSAKKWAVIFTKA